MKTANGAVIALLASSEYVSADLWTITLNAGTVIRWTSADRPISYGGVAWAKGPGIIRGPISEKTGPDVATLDVQLIALATDLINGAPLIPFIAAHGLDGASVKLERAFAPDWAGMLGAGPLGTVIRFAGKVTSVNSIQGAIASLTISSWMVLLNADMPRNLYQAACMHTLFDSGCTLNPASYGIGGSVTGSATTISFSTNLAQPAGYYNLGRLVFVSGPNSGVSRTVKSSDGSGGIVLVAPLPVAPLVTHAFVAYPGCDLSQGAGGCAKFGNLVNYKGTDFVPTPQTPISIPATSATTTSGKGGVE